MLQIQSISFAYQKEKTIFNASFSLNKGNSLAIIGESGCGKSTLLKLIYGLYDLNEGQIFWNQTEVLGPKYHLIPGMDFMKYLAQDFDLMPYITVAENVGKYLSNIDSEKKWNRVKELLEIVEMEDFFDVKAKNLSGGQMQRVAIARVLALEPEVLLLDEPFSHIDNFRKNSLRRKLFAYLKEKQITCLVATHDSTDVLSFTDEVLVMKNGEIIETGTPKSLYENPNSKYIASLFGDVNEINIEGKVKYIFPHQIEIVLPQAQEIAMKVEVLNSYFRGNHYLIEAKLDNEILFFEHDSEILSATQVHIKIK
ncbi:ABC transporter ATP-binding protein [Flavobacterium sp.]|uniref:ABC transporter ATP-binding protein n=1 Tax=Flavobacterium sp. TaxID=239 RepID=UPI00260D55B1|nr:ABC transporter ATP-binding protein [Flavobacterium sp.]